MFSKINFYYPNGVDIKMLLNDIIKDRPFFDPERNRRCWLMSVILLYALPPIMITICKETGKASLRPHPASPLVANAGWR